MSRSHVRESECSTSVRGKFGETMAYTIKEIADLAGVTTRTIRYYDQVGLLPPIGFYENGYRYYDTDSLFRLQQILFLRELDVPLKEIEIIINRPDFGLAGSLEKQCLSLEKKVKRLMTLIKTIDTTLDALKGEKIMAEKEYFNGFDESQYEDEVKERWGETKKYKESRKMWASYSKEQKEAIKAEGKRITTRMVGADANAAPDSSDVQAAISDYHAYLNKYFYTCDTEFLRGLADMWVEDARFAVNYERIREGGADFVRKAAHIFCDTHN